MSAAKFLAKHGPANASIGKIASRWRATQRIDDLLGTTVMSGVTIGDLLIEQHLPDNVPADIKQALMELMPGKADTAVEVRDLLLEKLESSPKSVEGMMSLIQGRLGEYQFKNAVDNLAQLSSDTSQEGWDLVSWTDGKPHYVQVKVYNSVADALEKVREVEAKVEAGKILGESQDVVEQIDFAVNSEIAAELKARVVEEGLSTEIIDIGATREQIRGRLEDMMNEADHTLDDFFSDFLDGVLSASAIHAAVNGFLVYKKAKAWDRAVEDTIYSTAVSAGGILAAAGTELFIAEFITVLGGPVVGLFVLGAGISGRSITRRITDRRYFAQWLKEDNFRLQTRILKLKMASLLTPHW